MFPGIEPPVKNVKPSGGTNGSVLPCHRRAMATQPRCYGGSAGSQQLRWSERQLLLADSPGWWKRKKKLQGNDASSCIIGVTIPCILFSSYIIANTMMIKVAASCNFCLRLNAGIWYLEWKLPRHADTRWHKTHKIICNKLTMGHVSHTDESYSFSFNGLPTRFIHKASMVQRPNIDFQRGTLWIPVYSATQKKKHHPYWY